MTAASAGDISGEQISSQPALRPAAILENIPGLIVTQHSGEGKANQYFLRAFNLDHGTDLALEVDDMPVNLPSHAHGQGYSDFNFVIPELVDDLHYKKGPYYADEGDFATAGTVRGRSFERGPRERLGRLRRRWLPPRSFDGICGSLGRHSDRGGGDLSQRWALRCTGRITTD